MLASVVSRWPIASSRALRRIAPTCCNTFRLSLLARLANSRARAKAKEPTREAAPLSLSHQPPCDVHAGAKRRSRFGLYVARSRATHTHTVVWEGPPGSIGGEQTNNSCRAFLLDPRRRLVCVDDNLTKLGRFR